MITASVVSEEKIYAVVVRLSNEDVRALRQDWETIARTAEQRMPAVELLISAVVTAIEPPVKKPVTRGSELSPVAQVMSGEKTARPGVGR